MPPTSRSHPDDLRVEGADRLADLEPHAAAWDELAAAHPTCQPMLTHAWARTVLELEGDEPPWIALFAYRGERLDGVLLARLETRRALGLRRVRAVVPCAYHTDTGDLVLRPDGADATLAALLRSLRSRVKGFLTLHLGGIRDDSPTLPALRGRPATCFAASEPDLEGSSFVIEGDVEDWKKGLSKNLRSDLKRSRNKARRDGLGAMRFTFEAGADADPARLEELMQIEASGWKGDEGTAIQENERTLVKYRGLAERFAARGMLEWHWLHYGDRLAAGHMAVRMGDGLMLLRQGLEHELGRYGPGNHLIAAMVEREFERGGTEVNLVTDYPWCRRWRMRRLPYHRTVLGSRWPWTWASTAAPVHAKNLLRATPGVHSAVAWWRGRKAGGGTGRS